MRTIAVAREPALYNASRKHAILGEFPMPRQIAGSRHRELRLAMKRAAARHSARFFAKFVGDSASYAG